MSVSPWAVKSEMQAPSDLGGEWFISERVCVSTGTRVEFRSTRVEAPTKAVGFGAARERHGEVGFPFDGDGGLAPGDEPPQARGHRVPEGHRCWKDR